MSLPYVILTILSREPATGYDISKAFSHNVGHFWKASHQQVYRELAKMTQLEWVTSELHPQVGKPDKKIYTILPLGRSKLTAWFNQPTPYTATRDEFSAKLMACSVESVDSFIQQLDVLLPEAQSLLRHYQQLENQFYHNPESLEPHAKLEHLILKRNILERQTWIKWASEVKQQLETFPTFNTVNPAGSKKAY
ncbi:MAG TPA: PadR family transcriptional regulator [Vibrio sp.]|uniref:PadR family transcriptional regulator n=1 Tax=Vibrio TaxID=662 RepID=UPI000688CCF2|nr:MULTISPECIES: PadR family transcriptional regulator [Vibrio]HCH01211.1 PadR family transcriptional regulator [Vibrio sp.]